MSEAFRLKHQARQSADWQLAADGTPEGLIGPDGRLYKVVTAETNEVTGGNDFSGDVSTLKLPAGVTDLTGGVSGGSASVIGAQHTQAATPADTAEHDLFSVEIPS